MINVGWLKKLNKELKLKIKIRNGFKCVLCGIPDNDVHTVLNIHHIDYNERNNSENNLIALCYKCHRKCHTKTQKSRQRWVEYFLRGNNDKEKVFITWGQIQEYCHKLCDFLRGHPITGIVPILRGGVPPALILSHVLGVPIKATVETSSDVIVDEIVDFGIVLKAYKKKYPDNLFVCIHVNKNHFVDRVCKPDCFCEYVDKFIVYPWEKQN